MLSKMLSVNILPFKFLSEANPSIFSPVNKLRYMVLKNAYGLETVKFFESAIVNFYSKVTKGLVVTARFRSITVLL